jgi:uncharacterized lipoprotein YddW (UPF0748 family)
MPRNIAAALAVGLVCASVALTAAPTRVAATSEIRGLWVQRASLASPQAIAALVRAARDSGFNTLLVQVRGRGEAFYRSDLEPRASELDAQAVAFDPLAMVLDLAHDAGLKVHAWFNVGLVSSATTLPRSRSHVALRHPEWLMVPRALAARLQATDPRSPGYLGTLTRWIRTNSETVEGLYLSPLAPGAVDHTAAVVAELVARYPIDGLHLDYIRYPGVDFDYAPGSLAEFRAAQLPITTPGDRDRFDRAAAAADPTAWTSARPNAWAAFRRQRLTALVTRLQAAARAARPELTVSAAVVPSASVARDQKFQDWSQWATSRLLDVVCPMLYTTDAAEFASQAASAIEAAAGLRVWAGIGAYRLTAGRTADHMRLARRAGTAGVVVFSYDSLIASTAPPDYLASLRPVLLESSTVGPPGR